MHAARVKPGHGAHEPAHEIEKVNRAALQEIHVGIAESELAGKKSREGFERASCDEFLRQGVRRREALVRHGSKQNLTALRGARQIASLDIISAQRLLD